MVILNNHLPRASVAVESSDLDGHLGFAVSTSVAFALVLWEYAALLPDEIRLYTKPVWGSVTPYAFITLRYSGLLATLPMLFLSVIHHSHCQVAASLAQAGVVLVVVSSAIIFTFRTARLWEYNRIVMGVLGGLVILIGACCIAVAIQFRAELGAVAPFGSKCLVLPTPPWFPLGYASATLFYVPVLILSLLKFNDHRPSTSVVGSRLYRAYLLILILITLIVSLVMILQTAAPASSILLLSAGAIAPAFIVAFGTRAFLNLLADTLLTAERARAQTLPYLSTSPTISAAHDNRYAVRPTSPSTTDPFIRTPPGSRPTTGDTDKSSAPLLPSPASSPPKRKNSAQSRDANPYTTFPSPPNSYVNTSVPQFGSHSPGSYAHSLLSYASTTPLRRPVPARQVPEQPKSEWSDT